MSALTAAVVAASAIGVPTLARAIPAPIRAYAVRTAHVPKSHVMQVGATTLAGEDFTAASTVSNAWLVVGTSCLTAGNATTPSTSIPACNSAAPTDPVGQGALQLTTSAQFQSSMVVYRSPIATANGLQITFTDYAFSGTTAGGADGMTVFLSDASKPMPTTIGQPGGSLGYANGNALPGVANAYIGVGLDEFGNFSNPNEGRLGGPGLVKETLAYRGAASTGYQYLGGATAANGAPASLPFSWDQPALASRPANAPTIRITLTAAGQLSAAVDEHAGTGFVTYASSNIVGVGGQPTVPPQVYIGFTASTGGSYNRHQIGSFSAQALTSSGPGFVPTQIANLAAWFDGADATSITAAGGAVSAWNDKSGNVNTLQQANAARRPTLTSAGINGLSSVSFNGTAYMGGTDPAFSTKLFNESTTFIVANQINTTQDTSLVWTGVFYGNPRWNLRLSENNFTIFDLNTLTSRTSVADVPTGPAMWTAAGSVTNHKQFVRKNGNLIGSTTGPPAFVTGNYPLTVGAMAQGTQVSKQFNGQLGEVLVFNRLLTAAEGAQIEGYLACKWALQSRLPANHPYRYLCPQGGGVAPPAAPVDALPEPTELRSQNGSLTFNVTAQANVSNGNPQLIYNGSNVPPTLRLLPGDTLIVNVVNGLAVPPAGASYMNDISLHYHGLHVTPNAPGDDSIDMIAGPGQTLQYQFTIPSNHPPGLYWYHSHAHGETERQTLAGMSGALIIDGIAQYAPQVANLPERVLIVRDTMLPGQPLATGNALQTNAMHWSMTHASIFGSRSAVHGMRPSALTMRMGNMGNQNIRSLNASGINASGMSASSIQPRSMNASSMHRDVRAKTNQASRNPYVMLNARYRFLHRSSLAASTHCTATEQPVHGLTVNGQVQPTIAIRPGEQQFWRLVNAGADTYLDVAVDNTNMQIVALDGVPVSSGIGTPPVLSVSHYVVPPSSRIEFIITGPPAATHAYLRTNCFDAGQSGNAMPAMVLAAINPNASITDLARLRARAHVQRVGTVRLPALRTVRAIKAQAVARAQTLYYSDQNTIDGTAFDPGAPPMFYAQSGTVEEWTIVNNANQVHTFHIHQIHFVVEAINGATLAQQFVMDNVNVPAATSAGPGSVKLLLDFSDPLDIGTFLLHCHILSHEDGGMMAKIRVGTAPPLTLSASTVTFAAPAAPSQSVVISGGQAPYSISGCTSVATAAINGTLITLAPTASGSCVLTVADSGSLIGTLSVTVQGAAAVVTLTPGSISFVGPTAASQTVTVSGGTLPYSGSGCSGTTTATLANSTLTVTPVAVGSCSITITDSAANSATLSISVNAIVGNGNPADNLTFHHNAMRSGWYSAEQTLTPATVATSKFGFLSTLTAPAGLPAFGKVYAQPLYVTAETVGNGSQHNLVIVATSTDQIYAYDDATRTVVWHRDFTNPTAGITNQSWTDSGCADISPNIGITGTPVIDRARDILYAVVATKENGNFHLRLHAISLATGVEATDGSGQVVGPVEVTASYALASGGVGSVSAQSNLQRSALLEANGAIYVALASHCDYRTSSTHGWMLAYSASTLQQTGNMLDLTDLDSGSTYFLGSPWMSGFGPSSDAQGNVYFATGNGPFDGRSNFSMSILELPGTLDITKVRYFTPAGAKADSGGDDDLGSGGVMLLPDLPGSYPHVLVAGGKCGAGSANGGTDGCMKYLLNRSNLGGQTSGDGGALVKANTGGGMWGGPATFQDANGANYIVYGSGAPLSTYRVNTSPLSLSVQSSANIGCLECRDGGSQPVVSSNGTQPATGVVWALKTPGNSGGTISLYAFDALTMNHTLFSGKAGSWTQVSGAAWIGGALVSPLVANGSVYVPVDGGVAVFGLHQ